MKTLKVGDKVKGFPFLSNNIEYCIDMDKFIGQIGIVKSIGNHTFGVDFTTPYETYWNYPLDHLLSKKINKIKNKLK